MNVRALLLFLHWVLLKYSETTFLSCVKSWWTLLCIESFHTLHCHLLTHMWLLVVHKWVFVVSWIKSQCQDFMWWRISFIVFICIFLHWKRFSFKCAFPFWVILFETFLFLFTSTTHNASRPAFIQVLGTGIFFNIIFINNLNSQNIRLFLQSIQIYVIHIWWILSKKHFIHISFHSRANKRLVHNIDDGGSVLCLWREN